VAFAVCLCIRLQIRNQQSDHVYWLCLLNRAESDGLATALAGDDSYHVPTQAELDASAADLAQTAKTQPVMTTGVHPVLRIGDLLFWLLSS